MIKAQHPFLKISALFYLHNLSIKHTGLIGEHVTFNSDGSLLVSNLILSVIFKIACYYEELQLSKIIWVRELKLVVGRLNDEINRLEEETRK